MSDWMEGDVALGDLTVRSLTGSEIATALQAFANLRVAVFREYPYLYDGDVSYEFKYLKEFTTAPGSVLVAAFDHGRLVGGATASPMWAQHADFREPFSRLGFDTSEIFFFGDSLLLPAYREAGIEDAFFDQREAAARQAGVNSAVFAAVIRPKKDPARPENYRPSDDFWRQRGYEPVKGLITEIAWKEHGEAEESPKRLQYWMRRL
jgi:GNAT superfamily N-acetyltransferase